MISLDSKPVTVAAFVLATLFAGSNARAQAASEPLLSAASIQSIQQQLNALKSEVTTLQGEVNRLATNNTTLRNEVAAVRANPVLGLGPFVGVTSNTRAGVIGPNIVFHGANVQIVSGSGATDDKGNMLGLGNLIIGYDEDPAQANEGSLQPGDRGGSHNLVIGRYNRFTNTAFGGLVAGEVNAIRNGGASVTGGQGNTASGQLSSVNGGNLNTASGPLSSVTGGDDNTASGLLSSVTGGAVNTASNSEASVTGGEANTASGPFSSVIGGDTTVAAGRYSVVLGSAHVVAANDYSITPQPPFPQ